MIHLVRTGDSRDLTVCGLYELPAGDTASFHTTDCPKCIPTPPAPVAPLPKCYACERGFNLGHSCGKADPSLAYLDSSRNPKTERIAFLERKREATKADLLMKFEDADWHGVQDCGSDLRDIESELKGLRFQ